MKLLAALFFASSIARADNAPLDYAQYLCVTPNSSKQAYQLLLEVSQDRDPVWPDRVSLASVYGSKRHLVFSAVDIFSDYLFTSANKNEKRYVGKNYNDASLRNKEIAIRFEAKTEIMKKGPFTLVLDFYDRRDTIVEGQIMSCSIKR